MFLSHLLQQLQKCSTFGDASLHSLSITAISAATVDAALCLLASSAAGAHLHGLHLTDLDAVPIKGLHQLSSNPNRLKLLTLRNIKGLWDEILVQVCDVFPLIEEIDVSCNGLSDKGILGIVQKLTFLRRVNLSGNVFITDNLLIALSDCCLDLQEVEVFGCSVVTQHGIGYVMRHCAKLKRISMNTVLQLRPEMSNSMSSIESSIGFCRNLSDLEFHTMSVEDTLLQSIAKANLPLTKFTASYCYKVSLNGLSTFLRAYPKLERLNLQGEVFLSFDR